MKSDARSHVGIINLALKGKRLSTLVEQAHRREPWTKPADTCDPYRLGSTKLSVTQRRTEFKQAITHDLEVAIRKLRPGHPPIQLIQMLDMDVDDMDTGEECLRQASNLLQATNPEQRLIGPAVGFYQALERVGLKVTFQQIIGPKRHGQETIDQMYDNYYVFLYVSLPDRPVKIASKRSTKKQR